MEMRRIFPRLFRAYFDVFHSAERSIALVAMLCGKLQPIGVSGLTKILVAGLSFIQANSPL